jgi:hypothetical protein
VFDEHLFPFANMHPNAGAHLQKEISILPDILLNLENLNVADQRLHAPNPSNGVLSSHAKLAGTVTNPIAISGESGSNRHNLGLHFMCPAEGSSTPAEADPPAIVPDAAAVSPSGSAPPTVSPAAVVSPSESAPAQLLSAGNPQGAASSGSCAGDSPALGSSSTLSMPQTNPSSGQLDLGLGSSAATASYSVIHLRWLQRISMGHDCNMGSGSPRNLLMVRSGGGCTLLLNLRNLRPSLQLSMIVAGLL